MLLKIFLITVFFAFGLKFLAQVPVLVSNDEINGLNTAGLQPTQPFLNVNRWDANLASFGLFFNNDYGYISKQSVVGLFGKEIIQKSFSANINGANTANVLDFFNKNTATFHGSSEIQGPAFGTKFKWKDKVYFAGIFTRLRTQFEGVNLDNYLRFNNNHQIPPQYYDLSPLKTQLMNWGEVGLNLGTEIFPYSQKRWIVAANFKYLMGFDAAQINSKNQTLLTRHYANTDSLRTSFSNYDVEANYATSYNFDNDSYELSPKGKGFGIDLGITVLDGANDDYQQKMAFHVLDLGYIRFDGATHHFQGKEVDSEIFNDYTFENPQGFLAFLSQDIYGNPSASQTGTDFTMTLPTSIHGFYSRKISSYTYLDFNFIQRIPVTENSLKRSNLASVSYAVRKEALAYGASVSSYDYQNLQFGAYFRRGPLVLGSQNLLPLLFKHPKLRGADFYIGIKIFPFWEDEVERHRKEKCFCD